MTQYRVTGMSCAACQARVEKAVSKVEGVTSCAVSLLTGSMGVEGTASDAAIIQAVVSAGYGASLRGAPEAKAAPADELADRETPLLLRRLLTSLGFLLLLMYVSMGHHMWGWPLPKFFNGDPVAVGLAQLLLAATVMLINNRFFVSGFRSVLHGAPNMDTLVALGSSASFLWSVYALFRMTDAQVHSGTEAAAVWLDSFYFESAAMILVLITVGKMLEARSKGKTTDALRSLMDLAPRTACVVRDGAEVTIPVEEVRKGDIFLVRPGESIPVDGTVLEGDTAVNEAALTGESIPVDKAPGDSVSAATVNRSGFIRCEAVRVGEDTALSQIIRLVSDAAATKAPIAKLADRVSGVFVPAVVSIAAVTLLVWLLIGKPFSFSLARAISVLVISCPCALGLATPVAIMVGSGVGARNGILFKTAVSLEETGKVRFAVLDKTGTITKGEPEVTELRPAVGVSEEELLAAAYALEAKSEHPLARAIVREAEKRGLTADEVTEFRALPGNGLTAVRNGEALSGGSVKFISTKLPLRTDISRETGALADMGRTPLLFASGKRYLGLIAVADTLKPESPEAILELENMGVSVVMLTGDDPKTAAAVASQAGISHIVAGVLPEGKEAVVRRLKELGKVAMVGDGINDAPALTAADMGIAIGAGTDVAIDAADVVLMNSRLSDVAAALRLSRSVLTNIRENLFWAFFYNVLCIPLAAGCYSSLLGWELNPMIGAAAMSLSSFCVVSNALRLNLTKVHSPKRDRKPKNTPDAAALADLIRDINEEIHIKTEVRAMTKTMKIEGMMCQHCEKRVKKALEKLDGVENAVASFEAGTAVLTLTKPVDDEALKAAVEAEDYPVLAIE